MRQAHGSMWALGLAMGAVCVGTPSSASAQTEEAPAAARTLHEAVEVAVRLSAEAASLPALKDQARALSRAGNSVFAGPPVANGDVLTAGSGSIEQEASVSFGLRWPGERRAIRSWAGSAGQAADSGFAAARLRIAGEVREAWWALAAARAVVAVNRDQVMIATTTTAQVTRLVNAGEQSRRDLLLAQSEVSAASVRLSQAEAEQARAEAAFAALAGPPPAELAPETVAAKATVDDSPAVRAADDRAAAADARARSLGYDARGRLEGQIGARRQQNGPGQGSQTALLVGVRVPFGRNQMAVADAASARSDSLAAGAQATQLRRQLLAGQSAAQRRLDLARAALVDADARRSALAQSFALTQKGQREGEIGFIEALRARQSLSEAERDLATVKVAYAAAISAFNQAMGVLP